MVNWNAVEAVGVWAAAGAAVFNVLYFIRFLKLTRAQVEALSKPVILMAATRTLPADDVDWLDEVIPTELELEEGDPRLINVGNGPALNLNWSYERIPDRVIRGKCAYLEPGKKFAFQFRVEIGGGKKGVKCEYESVAGAKYRSTTTLDDHKIVESKIEVITKQ